MVKGIGFCGVYMIVVDVFVDDVICRLILWSVG